MPEPNRYEQIISKIFEQYYHEGAEQVDFRREDIEKAARDLSIKLPKNIGDVIYSFRYRAFLPESIRKKAQGAGPGSFVHWVAQSMHLYL